MSDSSWVNLFGRLNLFGAAATNDEETKAMRRSLVDMLLHRRIVFEMQRSEVNMLRQSLMVDVL